MNFSYAIVFYGHTPVVYINDIIQHLCQKLPKSTDVSWSYSVHCQCHFLYTEYVLC